MSIWLLDQPEECREVGEKYFSSLIPTTKFDTDKTYIESNKSTVLLEETTLVWAYILGAGRAFLSKTQHEGDMNILMNSSLKRPMTHKYIIKTRHRNIFRYVTRNLAEYKSMQGGWLKACKQGSAFNKAEHCKYYRSRSQMKFPLWKSHQTIFLMIDIGHMNKNKKYSVPSYTKLKDL